MGASTSRLLFVYFSHLWDKHNTNRMVLSIRNSHVWDGGTMRLLTVNGKCNACGERVRTAREKAGISQEQLAAKVQLHGHSLTQKAVSRIEAGLRVVPDFEIPLLAKALNVSPLWLLGITEG